MYCQNFSCGLLKTRLKLWKSSVFSLLRGFLRAILNRVFNTRWKTFHSTPCKFRRVKMEFCRVFSHGGALFLPFAEPFSGARRVLDFACGQFIRGKVFHSFSTKAFPPHSTPYTGFAAGLPAARLSGALLCAAFHGGGGFILQKVWGKRRQRLILPP